MASEVAREAAKAVVARLAAVTEVLEAAVATEASSEAIVVAAAVKVAVGCMAAKAEREAAREEREGLEGAEESLEARVAATAAEWMAAGMVVQRVEAAWGYLRVAAPVVDSTAVAEAVVAREEAAMAIPAAAEHLCR